MKRHWNFQRLFIITRRHRQRHRHFHNSIFPISNTKKTLLHPLLRCPTNVVQINMHFNNSPSPSHRPLSFSLSLSLSLSVSLSLSLSLSLAFLKYISFSFVFFTYSTCSANRSFFVMFLYYSHMLHILFVSGNGLHTSLKLTVRSWIY